MLNPADHQISEWPLIRNAVQFTLDLHRPNTMYGFGDVDVTRAWELMSRLRREKRILVSPHAFMLHCLARAVADTPQFNAYRKGSKLVSFRAVDVGTTIERRMPGGERYATSCVIRGAESLSVMAITDQLRQASHCEPANDPIVAKRRRLARMPRLFRWIMARYLQSNPFAFRRMYGTVGLTSVAVQDMPSQIYPLPPSPYTLTLATGPVLDRPGLDEDGRIGVRKQVSIGIGADHSVTDGRMLARLSRSLVHHLRQAQCLSELL